MANNGVFVLSRPRLGSNTRFTGRRVHITIELLQQNAGLPQAQVAERLVRLPLLSMDGRVTSCLAQGISLTALKGACRQLGIPRWPCARHLAAQQQENSQDATAAQDRDESPSSSDHDRESDGSGGVLDESPDDPSAAPSSSFFSCESITPHHVREDAVLQPSMQMPVEMMSSDHLPGELLPPYELPMALQGGSEGGLHDRVVVDPDWLEWYMQPSGRMEDEGVSISYTAPTEPRHG
ncbi:hypothetical protein GUITHDRAFT_109133 [Guillardia theta CCMP2712]|uniref:RWP-RK domain-containing protein n=1 Tax=Guillardia theta (strain CCMP2712) TaxID=905079 RepID=L1J9S1_GUITC|nr:hypothetical protein GUITHDRAFT_109133 [Guillardia theta CCMP2712]EKX45087.1 hypothetical protein GUITHDRAFT_109133 [Guillardia theta CCMP2712]|eukprot:XP_005832067.1 hypothetical protein GUITHDRAFT_109133 [Guillardia theta CCMP2712]